MDVEGGDIQKSDGKVGTVMLILNPFLYVLALWLVLHTQSVPGWPLCNSVMLSSPAQLVNEMHLSKFNP